MSTALSTAITKDGQTTITANLPMATFRHTGVGNAVAATDYLAAGQAFGTFTGAADTGAADAYAIAPTMAIAAYAAYQRFQFVAANTNTTASTLAVSGLAAKAIKHLDGTALLAADIIAGEMVDVGYDGTNFQLLSATGLRGTASTWRAAQTFAALATMSGAAWNEAKGTNIASATTTDIGAAVGNYVHVTGTTTITGLGTIQAGTRRVVVFDGILLLTHNATSLILPNAGNNITTAAGDAAIFVSEGSGNWKCVEYQRASGQALVQSFGTPVTNSLSGNVTLNNTGTYFDGPSVAQGTTGTWLASGTITVRDTAFGSGNMNCKLWDGTTVIASCTTTTSATTNNPITVSLSGYLANPAANIKISVNLSNSTTGLMLFNYSGNSKDCTLSAIRIA